MWIPAGKSMDSSWEESDPIGPQKVSSLRLERWPSDPRSFDATVTYGDAERASTSLIYADLWASKRMPWIRLLFGASRPNSIPLGTEVVPDGEVKRHTVRTKNKSLHDGYWGRERALHMHFSPKNRVMSDGIVPALRNQEWLVKTSGISTAWGQR